MFWIWKEKRREREKIDRELNQTVHVMAVTDDKNLDEIGWMPLREVIKNDCIVGITVDRRIPF